MWDSVRFGPFTFSRRRRELRRSGSIVRIPNKAIEVLDLFLRSPGVTISKRDLYDALWGEKLVEESNLAQTIFCLRKALAGENGASAIKTVPGVGYAFVEDVTVCPSDLESIPVQALVTIAPYTNPDAASLSTARRLLQSGRHADARTFLEPMASKHLDASGAATFYSLRARARMDASDEARARDDVREAVRISRSADGASPAIALEAAMAQAYLAYRKGKYPVAIEIARVAVDAMPMRSMGPAEARLLAQAFIELATQELELGSTRDALAHLARADAALRVLPEPPAGLRCQILIQSALGYATSSSDFTRAIAYAREALQLAQWHQLDYEQVWADLTLAIIGQCAGTLPAARSGTRSRRSRSRVYRSTATSSGVRISSHRESKPRSATARELPQRHCCSALGRSSNGIRSCAASFTCAKRERAAWWETSAGRRSRRRARSKRSNATARRRTPASRTSLARGRGAVRA